MSCFDYDNLEAAYADAAKFGTEEPDIGFMHESTYWALMRHFHPKIKLPRKMKKRLFGTRRSRHRDDARCWT